MKAPHRIDLDPKDALSGLASLVRNRTETDVQVLADNSQALIALSVRSALDLFLQAKSFPIGSEVIVSAINHPDMAEILRSHGLVPVPVDLDFGTAAPSVNSIRAAATPSTRAVLVAHLFGGLMSVEEIASLCRERGWSLIEDCAQAFGIGYPGHIQSELTLFSFGPLKTATALAGALAVIRDSKTFETMAAIQARYPRHSRKWFLKRLALYSFLRAVSHPSVYGFVYKGLGLLGRDPSKIMRSLTKSFSGNFDINRFRAQLPHSQITFLKRRVSQISNERIRKRAENGERLNDALTGIERFGASGLNRTHWIFPISVSDPESVITALEREGVHAMRGLSNLAVVEGAGAESTKQLDNARPALSSSLLVPLPRSNDNDTIQRIVRAVRSVQYRNPNRLRVATINIWSGLDYQGWLRCGSYETDVEREMRYQHLVNRLRELDADVIAINEANPVSRMMRRLAQDLGYDEIHWRGLAGLRLGPFGLPVNLDEGDGILARPHLKLKRVGRVRLTGGFLGRWGSLNFANATQVVCGQIVLDGKPLYLFNTHWTIAKTSAAYAAQETSRDLSRQIPTVTEPLRAEKAHHEASRIRFVEALRTIWAIHRLLPEGAGAVLCGDLNTAPGSPEIRALEDAGFIDAVRHLRYQEGATWDPARNDIIRKFYGSVHASAESAIRVDYIFANNSIGHAIEDVRVALNGTWDRPHPSDHFALVCDLDLSASQTRNRQLSGDQFSVGVCSQ